MAASPEGTGAAELPASRTSRKKRKQYKPVAPELLGFRPAGEAPALSATELLRTVCNIVRIVVDRQRQAYESPEIESKQTSDIDTQEVLNRYPCLRDNLPILNAAFDLLCDDQVLQTGDRRGLKQRWCWMTLTDPATILYVYESRLSILAQASVMSRWRL